MVGMFRLSIVCLLFSLLLFCKQACAREQKTAAAQPSPRIPGNIQQGTRLQKFFRGASGDKEDADALSEQKSAAEEKASGSSKSSNCEAETNLVGALQFSTNLRTRDYELGVNALEARLFADAEYRFKRACQSLKDGSQMYVLARLGLAEAYLARDNFDRARVVLNELRSSLISGFGSDSNEIARYFAADAKLSLVAGRADAALSAAEESLRIRSSNMGSQRDLALALCLYGKALHLKSYFAEAKEYFKKSLKILELEPGKDRIDYADALEALSRVEKKLGNEKESSELMKKALAIKNDAVKLQLTADHAALVKFDWEEGLYGSRQIIDPVYPLKYMVVGGVRVAVTLVRSYKHLAVLVSLANCSDHPLQLAAGVLSLEKTSPGHEKLEFCDPGLIDEVLEEEVILSKTWRRRTLCHLQKSRRIPGYLKNNSLDADDFFGNNEFGLYGAWENSLRDKPPIVTREQFFFDDKPKGSDQEILGFMRGNGAIHPTYIEAGAAKTAIVFFLRKRYEEALVRVSIGNAELTFPFHTAPGQ